MTAVFYLTARTTGRRAAEQALDQLRAQGVKLRSIAITAKDKCCPMPRRECFGCPAGGGLLRAAAARAARGALARVRTPEAVAALAEEYELCPYELSLDLSEQADVIVCDYNYAFDPRVRLRRYFEQKSKAGLLVDEAHNLPDRAREMFSAELSGAKVEAARREIGRYEGRRAPAWEALTDLLRALTRPDAEPESLESPPEEIVQAARLFADRAGQLQSPEPQFNELMLDALWFVRTAGRFDPQRCRALILPEGKRIAARLWCFDPSEHLKKALGRVGGAALFSATLAPMDHYARQARPRPRRRVAPARLRPFPPENQLTVRLPVRCALLRPRAHAGGRRAHHPRHGAGARGQLSGVLSLVRVSEHGVRALPAAVSGRRGRAPDAAHGRGRARRVHRAVRRAPRRAAWWRSSCSAACSPRASTCRTTGCPARRSSPRNPADRLRAQPDGRAVRRRLRRGAPTSPTPTPGIRRVLQAAGRVIRTETDRGVVLLVDLRYGDPHIRALLPEHWRLERAKRLADLEARLKDFWADAGSIEM